MAVDVMPDVEHRVEGVPTRVSSSAVRAALARADFDKASALLGRPYEMSGRVVAGERLGHQLGFPTANMTLSHRPALSGIFAVRAARIEGGDTSPWIDGVASLGYRPTVNRTEKPLLEVHLFDFDENLYGQHLRVRFLHKLRDEAKFDDLGQLRAAIAEDARQARAYLNAS
jgi:riboflavin kinase/FMN adenylyltransferase